MRKPWLVLPSLLIFSLACSLPGLLAAPTPRPTPPTLVEIDPPPGSALGPRQALTLYFDQPMDATSVEGALRTEPAIGGRFTWLDERTVRFEPEVTLPPNSTLKVELTTSARAANGLALVAPAQATYHTPPTLQVAQTVPSPDAQEINPAGDLLVAFNQPVVPLGADPATLPPAFTLDPPASGQGEWLNTSTYRFRPEPALTGGATYTIRLNRDLTALSGAPLDPDAADWTFTTAAPRLLQIDPDPNIPWEPTTAITLTFNQPMDAKGVVTHFALLDADSQPVPGEVTWDERHRVMTFTPAVPLQRAHTYRIALDAAAPSAGGTPIGQAVEVPVEVLPPLVLRATSPADGGTLGEYQALTLYFTAPVDDRLAADYLHFDPPVENPGAYWDDSQSALRIAGDFQPDTDYTLTVDASLPDRWGEPLGEGFTLRFHTAPLSPALNLNLFTSAVSVTPDRAALPAQAASLRQVQVSTASITLKDFILALAPGDYLNRLHPSPQFSQAVDLDAPTDRYQDVSLPLTTDGESLPPGLYLTRLKADALRYPLSPLLVVSSRVQLTYKQGATDALVWAVRDDGTPLADAPVRILDDRGYLIASGHTDANGLLHLTHAPITEPYATTYAIAGEVGEDDFGLAVSDWNLGITAWDFGYRVDRRPPHTQTYLYTDRPIYRPGDTVYFRAVTRTAFNGRYTLPETDRITVTLEDYTGALDEAGLPLSAFGTAHGAFTLPDDAQPGVYSLRSGDDAVYFEVADYRKPAIDLQVSLSTADLGEPMLGEASAQYFFGAPAANLPLRWSLYVRPETLALPDGYQSGPLTTRWTPYAFGWGVGLGDLIEQGETATGADGYFAVGIPTIPGLDSPCAPPEVCRYTLEVTVTDLNGQPVSARATSRVLPGGAIYGVRPTAWVGKAGKALTFEVQAFDADLQPTLAAAPRVTFGTVTWEKNPDWPSDPFASPLTPVFTPLESAPVALDAQGHGTISFTPPEGGTYLIRVEQDFTVSEALVWVSGAGKPTWPSLPNQHLPLQADKDAYQPGETAHVLIPNPFGEALSMLVTLERGTVLNAWVQTLPADGLTLDLPLTDEHAPNVYLSVTLLDAPAHTFRQGYLNLAVTPVAQTLQVEAAIEPTQAAPGEPVTLNIRVTDADGQPVQGEFSVAVIDRAVLALAEPNAPDILEAFYGTQPGGVITALTLAADVGRTTAFPGGIGGGGGAAEAPAAVVRERFPDTALWEGAITTDADGRAALTVPLPDNLTTWEVRVRGLDDETRVGEAATQIVVSKPVFVRPVTPRFLVVGDRVQLAAIVHNTTDQKLTAQATLQADGVTLDDPAQATQTVSLPPHGRARVTWWVTALDVPQVDLVFQVQAGDYQDAARPALGALPVHRYAAPQTFATAGVLEAPGDRLEIVALPRTFTPLGGELSVTLAPSLAGALVQAVERAAARDLYSNESRAARLMMIAATAQALRQAGVVSPVLERAWQVAEADAAALLKAQAADGGWGWWPGDAQPSPRYTASALIALHVAAQAGLAVPEEVIAQGIGYLQAALPPVSAQRAGPGLDTLALAHFALTWNGAPALAELTALATRRAELSPWAQALTLAALAQAQPDAPELATLTTDLLATAVRSASGAHWESRYPDCGCFDRAEVNTAIVLYALAQRDATANELADAVRYLTSARTARGDWRTLPANGWAALALSTYLVRHPADLQPDFDFAADLNDHPLLQGSAHSPNDLNPVHARVPLDDLLPANLLVIRHGDGTGNLYYTVHLTALRPAEEAPPLDQGIHVERRVEAPGSGDTAQVGNRVRVYLTLTTAQTLYHVQVDEPIPAGTEVIQRALQTAEQGTIQDEETPLLPWGAMPFQRFDLGDHITWVAEELLPGTYELTYTLVVTQVGEYRWLPTRAWETYFPEVQGTSNGMIFRIEE